MYSKAIFIKQNYKNKSVIYKIKNVIFQLFETLNEFRDNSEYYTRGLIIFSFIQLGSMIELNLDQKADEFQGLVPILSFILNYIYYFENFDVKSIYTLSILIITFL